MSDLQAMAVPGTDTMLEQPIIDAFRASMRGEVILPGDSAYDKVRRIWNASIDKRPALIARCTGVADVKAAVNFARENQLLVAVRGGGHNVGGRAICDGGIMIDLSLMRAVLVNVRNRSVRVQGGATLGEVDRETHVFGLATPLGVISKTGVGGLTLGGGVGWLVRKYGLTCDNVLSFEVVTADGKVLVASADDNEDLFWGLRGGGGNFGIVTSFEYKLYPVSTVLSGLILFPRDMAVEVLRFFRDFMQTAPDELTAYAGLIYTPDGMPVVGIIACYCGDISQGEQVLQPLRTFATPLVDAIQPMPFPQMQSLLDGAFPDGTHNYWKSSFINELSDEAIQVIVEHANQATSPLTGVVVECYGGAASRVGTADTAFAQRQTPFDVGIMSQWTDPADSSRHINWTRAFADALKPFSSGGYLLNFLGQESEDTIKAAFGHNYERLVQLKNKYDPTNFFRLNQNVKPTL